MPRIAINGFGRIGRHAFKVGFETKGFEVVAINDLTDAPTLAALLSRDTVYGGYFRKVKATNNALFVDGKRISVFAEKNPEALPWKKLGVDLVLECTGRFTDEAGASLHLKAGAKKVLISAPGKGGDIPTYIMGVNHQDAKKDRHKIFNNGSCTTNSVAPVAAIIGESFGVKKAMLSTVHAYTADQNLQDGPHKDLRRARAAAGNIVPTTTGAAISVTEALPELKGKFDGTAFRVPVIVGSLTDFTFVLKKRTTVALVNAAFKKAARSPRWRGILEVTEEPLVSSDIVGTTASAIVDLGLTKVVDGDLLKVVAWYDNEWAYAHRLVEMAFAVS